jgi:imidazole glycerol-phosphate synthase subunit HisH
MAAVIDVIDYDIGNVGSVINMLKHVGAEARLASTAAEIDAARALLLPGVGHFGYAMDVLRERGFIEPIKRKVMEDQVPILGICLGMQLLSKGSEEGNAEGFGFLDAHFERIAPAGGLKVPHMGWNVINVKQPNPVLSQAADQRFYFVHSYKAVCDRDDEIVATCSYGEEFCCAYGRDNVYGVQFHPEKSHRFGMDLFRRFVAFAC